MLVCMMVPMKVVINKTKRIKYLKIQIIQIKNVNTNIDLIQKMGTNPIIPSINGKFEANLKKKTIPKRKEHRSKMVFSVIPRINE